MSTLKDLAEHTLSIDRLHDDGVPTASIAILEDGKISSHVLTKGPEHVETVYQAASISKAICSLAVAKLVDDGKLSYETKAVDHLDPALIDVMVDNRTRHFMRDVTIKMLVSHTSGLSQHGFGGYAGEAPSTADIIAGRAPSNTPRMRFLSFPGSQGCYSGGGFVLLQLMLEIILGKSFPEIMQDTVLKPLGMSRSWYGDIPPGENNFARAHWTAHTPADVERGYNILPEMAAAALWTTPTDLLKAVSAIQDSLYTTSGFLKQDTAKLLLSKVVSNNSLGTVALGWWINDVGFGHGGSNFPGYETYFCGFHGGANTALAEEKPRTGMAIMTNSVLGHEMCVKQIIGAIMHAKGWKGSMRKEDLWLPSARDGFVPYPAPSDAAVDEGWKAWEGKWEGGWDIVEKDAGPALVFEKFPPMKLMAAAAPVKEFEVGKKEVWLVVDGLSIGVRLTWNDEGKEVVKLQLEEEQVLQRAS